MIRESVEPRPDWFERIRSVGLTFDDRLDPYWREEACYGFTEEDIDRLETATAVLHALCLKIVEDVIRRDRFEVLGIPVWCRNAIRRSWEQSRPTLYGRFDLRYDGHHPPVLLEYNADTPTSLIEASVAQWHWLEDRHPDRDQFNSLHEALVARWASLRDGGSDRWHFAGLDGCPEDNQTVSYLIDTARQAGLDAVPISVGNIGWDRRDLRFVDKAGKPINALFKLYPWEWLVAEPFGPLLLTSPVRVVEPAWKMILSNKGLLALLWERFPGHPNLLPAYFTPGPLGREYVIKPLLSREGANITLVTRSGNVGTPGPYGGTGFVYQALAELPAFQGQHPVIGSWVIGGEPAGIGIRESTGLITDEESCFVPHYFMNRQAAELKASMG